MKAYFDTVSAAVCRLPAGSAADRVTLNLASETSEFVRFNRGAVRQMTHVEQHQATVTVIAGQRRATGSTSLSGVAAQDIALLLGIRDELARDLPMVPPDPHLLMPVAVSDSFRDDEHALLPSVEELVALVIDEARGLDLVGFYAAGPVVEAFADSRGQRNWHRVPSFHLDWSLYCNGDPAVRDRAVKSTYAGARWDRLEFSRRMAQARERLALLEKPARKLSPGAYRAWLEPAAVAEMLGTLAWGGFGVKSRRTGTSTLMLLETGAARLAEGFDLTEAPAEGVASAFTSSGHVRPRRCLSSPPAALRRRWSRRGRPRNSAWQPMPTRASTQAPCRSPAARWITPACWRRSTPACGSATSGTWVIPIAAAAE